MLNMIDLSTRQSEMASKLAEYGIPIHEINTSHLSVEFVIYKDFVHIIIGVYADFYTVRIESPYMEYVDEYVLEENMPTTAEEMARFCAIYIENHQQYVRLEEISRFENNWNSYGSEPIFENVIKRSKMLIEAFSHEGICTGTVFPVAARMTQFDQSYREMEIEITVHENHYSFYTPRLLDMCFELTLERLVLCMKSYIAFRHNTTEKLHGIVDK